MFDNIYPLWFIETDDYVYFGTENGTIERFEGQNDNGVAISARLELAFTAFGLEEWIKNIFYEYLTIASATRTSCTIKYATDEDNEEDTDEFLTAFVLMDYDDIDYADWSYATNRNPQSDTIKATIKKFQYIKHIFTNDEIDEDLTILSWKVSPTIIKEAK
jgi:hypothetical protein